MHSRAIPRIGVVAAAAALLLVTALPASAETWYSGQRAFGNVSVEPAVNDADGSQIFLLTPNGAQTNANPRAHAPLYLVLYPDASTIPASTLNCTPTNCNHAQIPGMKGHDHLVGLPHTGDFNVAWDVYPVVFTPHGIADGAMNTRLLTLSAVWAAKNAGDVFVSPTVLLAFNCSKTSMATYLKGTPYSG
jgi:hypothetical protein